MNKVPGIRSVSANLGRGNPQVYYNHIQRQESASYAEVLGVLEKYDPRRTPADLDALRTRLDGYPGARISVL